MSATVEAHEREKLRPKTENPRIKNDAKITRSLVSATCCAALGSSFQFGYNLGVINQPKTVVQDWIRVSHSSMYGEDASLSMKEIDVIWSWVVAIYCIGGMAGGLVSGIVAERFGRKGGMRLNNIIAFIAAAILGLSKTTGVYYMLFLGRILIGFNAGLNTGLVPMYLTEIAPVKYRGAIGTTHQLAVTISILVSTIVGLPSILGNDRWWPLLFALTAVPALYQSIAFIFCPESPCYLLVDKKQKDHAAAEAALMQLRGTKSKALVATELEQMENETDGLKKKVRFMEMFHGKTLFWPLVIAIVMMLSQQLSGINVAMNYSTAIFISASLSNSEAMIATIVMGVINVLMTVVSTIVVDKFGRRVLHIAGMTGMLICSILLVICLLNSPHRRTNAEVESLLTIQNATGNYTGDLTASYGGSQIAAYSAIILVFLFVISFATGPGSIPWFYVSETFAPDARSNANSVAVVFNWSAAFIVGLIFLPLNNAIGPYTFLVFAGCLIIFIIFTYLFAPETQDRKVEDVVADFAKKGYLRVSLKPVSL